MLVKPSYLTRRGHTFCFRRRPISQFMVNDPITISLKTRDRDLACFLAVQLTAKWDKLIMTLKHSKLTARENLDLLRYEIDAEIGRATEAWWRCAPEPGGEDATFHLVKSHAIEIGDYYPDPLKPDEPPVDEPYILATASERD